MVSNISGDMDMQQPEMKLAMAGEKPVTQGAPVGVGAPAPEVSTGLVSFYVGDLNPEVNEAMLFEKFTATVSNVSSIRVCRNAVTRRSLCYAYVNFNSHDDAKRALEELNYEPLKGKPMRIMWSHRDPSLRRSGNGNIFIKNLEKTIDNKSLYDTFADFGDILSCKVVTDERGESKGFGFVHFVQDADADKAIETVNGKMIAGQQVFAAKFVSKRDRQTALGSKAMQFTNIFLKNLPTSMDEETLKRLCEEHGPITSHVIMRDEAGNSRGFGFVNFEDAESAAKAVDSLNNREISGSVLYVGRAQKKSERKQLLDAEHMSRRRELDAKTQGVNLYVKNLDESIDDEALRKAFAEFGNITSAKVMRDQKGVSRGFGFVCFSAPEEATKAVTEMNGKIVAVKPLYVALAQRKQDRAAFINAQRANRMQYRQQMGMNMPMYFNGQMPSYPMRYPQQMGPQRGSRWQPHGPPMGNMMPMTSMRPMMPPGAQVTQRGGGGRRAPTQRNAGGNNPTGPRPGGKFTNNSRNTGGPMGPGMMVPPMGMQAGPQQGIDMTLFANLSPNDRRQFLGEKLFPRIRDISGEALAGKITGMLLEMETSELLSLLEEPSVLRARVDEALNVLEEHNRTSSTA
jgi:polyadenylate-binding protein